MKTDLFKIYGALEGRDYNMIYPEGVHPVPCELSLADLVFGIVRDYPDQRLMKGIPVVLALAEQREVEDLVNIAQGHEMENPTGYLLETVADVLPPHHRMRGRFLGELSGHLVVQEQEYVIPQGWPPDTMDIIKSWRTDIARAWNVVDHVRKGDFEAACETYLRLSSPGSP